MILGTFKKTITEATEIPLGPQWGNSRTHQGGPSPRQPDVVEAGKKFSLPLGRAQGTDRVLERRPEK